ncbi:N-acetylgalactosamine 6-sulfate sulfatase [Labilibacter sediminis]|nr:N-acetylgalactosamine 6-sulfate sulfatase [Labilibacter sediminis]
MRNSILFFLFIITLNCIGENKASGKTNAPNIILILVDDLGKEWLSCYGAEDIQTPNIDRLAKSGILFNNAYGMPQCTPSRVTLLTGQYPFRHGWVNHWDVPNWGGGAHFDESLNPSLIVEMKKAGYKTCIAGKWQIDDFRVEPDALTKIGFDEFCMWTGQESGNPLPSGKRYHSPYIFTKDGSRTYEKEYGPDIFKNFICDFIKANKDTSMFIYYPMVLTHTPFVNPPNDSATDNLGKHKAMVRYADKITQELINTIEDAGIRENTIIIWTTDNGTTGKITGKRNGRKVKGGKAKTTEAGVCLPFIISYPSLVDSNTISNSLIDFTDVLPTCIDLTGRKIGKEYTRNNTTHYIDGVSFKQALLKNEKSPRKWILSMGGGNNAKLTDKGVENKYLFRDRVIRNERFKLRIDKKRKAIAFYDLLENPNENINLIDSLNTQIRKENFEKLYEITGSFPKKDADPKYKDNPAQEWDVEVSAKSQIWKH